MGNLGNLGCKCGARVRATRVKTAIIWLSQRIHPTMHSICRYYTENFKFLQEFSTSALQLEIQNTRTLCKDVIFLNAPRSALIHRGNDYVGQIMQEKDSQAAHYALHYAIHTHDYALCSWEILASGARWWCAIYISDRFWTMVLELATYTHIGNYVCAKNYMAWSVVMPSDQFNSKCCHLMWMAIRA